jgi:glycosyltransferase involved in cell wall biosynthesis
MFSLVVATKNRTADLKIFLESLVYSSYQNYEVVLVDQSEDLHALNNERLAKNYAFVRYIRDSGCGLSRARNIGLNYVSGTILAFPDDDCWYPSEILKRVHAFLSESPCHFLCGSYQEPGDAFPVAGNIKRSLNFFSGNANSVSSVGIFINLRKVALKDISFDEKIGAGTSLPSGEETDLILRLIRKGYRGVQDTSFFVYHPVVRESTFLPIEKKIAAQTYVRFKNKKIPFVFFSMVLSVLKDVVFIFSRVHRKAFFAKVKGICYALGMNEK